MNIPWELDRRGFLVVICCFVCGFMTTFDIVMISTTLGPLQDAYHVGNDDVMVFSQMVAITYVLFFMLSVGITDRYGKRKSMITGLILVGVSSLLCCFAPDFGWLTAFRIVTGLGISLMQTSCNSILTDAVRKEYLGEAMAVCYSSNSFGAILAPLVAYPIASMFGIGSLFILVIPVCIVVAYVLKDIDNIVVRPDLKINYPIHVLYVISMTLLIVAAFDQDLVRRVMCAVAGAVALVLTAYVHKRSPNKVIDGGMFRIKAFTVSVALAFMFSYVGCGIENSLSQFFQLADFNVVFLGAVVSTAAVAAIMTSFKPVIQMILSPVIARYFRDRSTSRISLFGFVLMLMSAVLALVLFNMGVSAMAPLVIVMIYVLHALAGSFFTPYNKTVMMTSVPEEDRNAASSLSSAIGTAASIVGVLTLVNLISGSTELADFRGSVIATFVIMFAVAIVGTLIAAARRHTDENEDTR